jgi:hypothetical protein
MAFHVGAFLPGYFEFHKLNNAYERSWHLKPAGVWKLTISR